MSLAPARADRRFEFPEQSRAPSWVWLLALVLHVPLLFVGVYRDFIDEPGSTPLIRLSPTSPIGERRVELSLGAIAPTSPGAPLRGPATASPRSARPQGITPVQPPNRNASDTASSGRQPIVADPLPPSSSVGVTPPGATTPEPRRIGPAYASGKLWVRPLPMSPQELADRLRGKTHNELLDSAVTAIIQDYLDRMATEERGRPEPLPAWTTTIAGKTVGVDSKWIYLGPIRVPTFLLRLIPLNVQANPTQAEINRRLGAMREDLMNAARRSANYADFKEAVSKLREEKQRERDFQKAQRTPPSEQDKPQ